MAWRLCSAAARYPVARLSMSGRDGRAGREPGDGGNRACDDRGDLISACWHADATHQRAENPGHSFASRPLIASTQYADLLTWVYSRVGRTYLPIWALCSPGTRRLGDLASMRARLAIICAYGGEERRRAGDEPPVPRAALKVLRD